MPKIDIVVPTIEGREESLERCIASYEAKTLPSISITFYVVKNSASAGEGWIEGLQQSDAPYIHLTCDDLEVKSTTWAERCIETVDKGQLPCPVVYRPDGGIESCGGDMRALANLTSHLQDDWTPADFTTLPFVSREQIEAIGMLPIHYSSDVWVSYRGRQLGYETVVRRGYEFIHYQEQAGRGAGMAQGERAVKDHQLMRAAL